MMNNIKFIDLLLESLEKGPKIGSGTEHDIYQSLTHEDRVIKCKRDNTKNNIDWIELFRKNPKYFPKVFKTDNDCTEVEKLDIDNAKKDYDILEKILEDDAHRFVDVNEDQTLAMILVNLADNPVMIKQVSKVVKDKKPEYLPLLKKFFMLVKGVTDSMNDVSTKPDIHKLNFGYAKDGTLKMIDV